MSSTQLTQKDARTETVADAPDRSIDDLAEHMSENICKGFITHDDRQREACIEAFFEVDRYQFPYLSEEEAYRAATAYVDALWAKDDVEEPYVKDDGSLDRDPLDDADWSPVVDCLERRADIVGMSREYATATTDGWRKHKTGGDYWTPHMRAQLHEVRAALDAPEYPHKRGSSRHGLGPLPARYLVGIELHDMKSEEHWEEAVDVMQSYYAELLRNQRDD
ncbi:hypothetical protein KTS45_12075 [Halomicroarcula limicola]|uniref:Uncharacterized protein n=1 Tax=Haloarcula limicola TaxID=1429915 RepID=A0A8J7Y5J7_9EURY|nr:hypothetical protein [Halomicroarcula limicola]MBV0924935.1 hypothetical protein [Halomicroarcula limicola]